MPSSYSSRLRIELIANGEQVGSWGDTTNRNLGTLLEQSIAGATYITLVDADYTLATLNGAADEARAAILIIEGTASALRSVIIPQVTKIYVVSNTSFGGQAVTIRTSSGVGYNVPNGVTAQVYCNGQNVTMVASNQTSAAGTVTSITAVAPLTGGTITGSGSIGLATMATVTPGTYGSSSAVPVISVDVYGRVTAASQVSISGGAGSGTVTLVNTGSGLIGGPISTTGTISLATSGVASGTYGSSTTTPVITVDSFGRITSASTTTSSVTAIANGSNNITCTTSGITGNTTGTFAFTGAMTISKSLTVTQTAIFNDTSGITIKAATVATDGTTRWGGSNQIFKIGSDSGTANRLLLATSGSVVRGLMWDGSTILCGRGVMGGDANVVSFAGDGAAGSATFTSGNVYKPGGGSFAASSDERLKNIHGLYTKGLDELLQLQPIEYSYREAFFNKRYIGLSAQKIQLTPFASMVGTDEGGYFTLDNSELVYALINAVKEINFRLTQLEMA